MPTITATDRANLTHVPQGIAALAEVRRELRRKVSERNDAWLDRCCLAAGIKVEAYTRRTDAMAFTRHAAQSLDSTTPIKWLRVEAMASDRTYRGAIKRLLAVFPDVVQRCASSFEEWHSPRA